MQSPRYAIYFTPKSSTPLAQFGASVLGYDASAGKTVPHIVLKHVTAAELAAGTGAPRTYGFHATLVAPFYLNGSFQEMDLVQALGTFCHQSAPARLGFLQVNALGDFIALIPAVSAMIDSLARNCVTFFDSFRAPLSPQDLVRRSNGRLTPSQQGYLERWGYPYIFEDFRFHMTLTGALGPDEKLRFLGALTEAFAPLADQSHTIDAISLVRQADPRSRFEVIARKDLARHCTIGLLEP